MARPSVWQPVKRRIGRPSLTISNIVEEEVGLHCADLSTVKTGLIIGRIFASEIWGGLFSGGLNFGGNLSSEFYGISAISTCMERTAAG